jgi:hypothetical protein
MNRCSYPYGNGKNYGCANFGVFEQKWGMLRVRRLFMACSVRQRHSRSNGNLLMISIRLANAIRNLYINLPNAQNGSIKSSSDPTRIARCGWI